MELVIPPVQKASQIASIRFLISPVIIFRELNPQRYTLLFIKFLSSQVKEYLNEVRKDA